jgi:hypothetical protein
MSRKIRALLDCCGSSAGGPFTKIKRRKTIDRFRRDDNQLKALLRDRDLKSIVFVVISLLPQGAESRLGEVGLSIWSPGQAYYERECLHWVIKEGPPHKTPDAPIRPSFYFGETEYVKSSEIGPLLHDEIFSLQQSYSHICIVGHGTGRILGHLREFWQVPNGAKVIDTQKVWQYQQKNMCSVPLLAALEIVPSMMYEKQLLGNAGNEAQFTLYLLRALGEVPQHPGNSAKRTITRTSRAS